MSTGDYEFRPLPGGPPQMPIEETLAEQWRVWGEVHDHARRCLQRLEDHEEQRAATKGMTSFSGAEQATHRRRSSVDVDAETVVQSEVEEFTMTIHKTTERNDLGVQWETGCKWLPHCISSRCNPPHTLRIKEIMPGGLVHEFNEKPVNRGSEMKPGDCIVAANGINDVQGILNECNTSDTLELKFKGPQGTVALEDVRWVHAGTKCGWRPGKRVNAVDEPKLPSTHSCSEISFADQTIEGLATEAAQKAANRGELYQYTFAPILSLSVGPFRRAYVSLILMPVLVVMIGTASESERGLFYYVVLCTFMGYFLRQEYRVLRVSIIPFVQEVNTYSLMGRRVGFKTWLIINMVGSASNIKFLADVSFAVGHLLSGHASNKDVSKAWRQVVNADAVLDCTLWLGNVSNFALVIILVHFLKSLYCVICFVPWCIERDERRKMQDELKTSIKFCEHLEDMKRGHYRYKFKTPWLLCPDRLRRVFEWANTRSDRIDPAESFHQVVEGIGMLAVSSEAIDWRVARIQANENRRDKSWLERGEEWQRCLNDFRIMLNIMSWRIVAKGFVAVPKILLLITYQAAHRSPVSLFSIFVSELTSFGPVLSGILLCVKMMLHLRGVQKTHKKEFKRVEDQEFKMVIDRTKGKGLGVKWDETLVIQKVSDEGLVPQWNKEQRSQGSVTMIRGHRIVEANGKRNDVKGIEEECKLKKVLYLAFVHDPALIHRFDFVWKRDVKEAGQSMIPTLAWFGVSSVVFLVLMFMTGKAYMDVW